MSGLIFAFFVLAILLFFSTCYTLFTNVKRAKDQNERKRWERYSLRMGVLSFLSLSVGLWLYMNFL
ncbi:hypothetical protein [Alkalihalobacterium elongatum]|uniref:hypothetical protein n=1 Tax=Alkalihalobacterium elongatum TaxID=2675466 RepID=UPI001C1FCB53|nr:hypothetical protein [Alkalihalobacterium elongatum]